MNIVFSPSAVQFVLKLLFVILFYKLLQMVGLYFLPQSGVYKVPSKSLDLPYLSLRLDKSFEVKKEVVVVEEPPEPPKEVYPIESLVLKAVYWNKKNRKDTFIVVIEKGKQDTHILGFGDIIKEYKFVDISSNREAIFEARGQRYNLSMDTIKEKKNSANKGFRVLSNQEAIQKINEDVILAVPKEEILKYRKDFKSIWKNISIREVVKDGKIDGFLIQRIKSGSIFSKLGLKEGDVIKSVNNNRLKSYADAFKIYYKIDNLRELKLTVTRNNKEKELEYEVY